MLHIILQSGREIQKEKETNEKQKKTRQNGIKLKLKRKTININVGMRWEIRERTKRTKLENVNIKKSTIHPPTPLPTLSSSLSSFYPIHQTHLISFFIPLLPLIIKQTNLTTLPNPSINFQNYKLKRKKKKKISS